MPKQACFRMVEGRWMSPLTSFEDDELAAGLAKMETRYADRDVLSYDDHFDDLTALSHGQPSRLATPRQLTRPESGAAFE
jgi:hypothetical protein